MNFLTQRGSIIFAEVSELGPKSGATLRDFAFVFFYPPVISIRCPKKSLA